LGAVRASGLVWHREPAAGTLSVQVRSAGAALPVGDLDASGDGFTARLEAPATGVAPGQTAVVYDEDRVVVAGTIAETQRWALE
jgi:tRNA-uridine 2-sulfurtransferase